MQQAKGAMATFLLLTCLFSSGQTPVLILHGIKISQDETAGYSKPTAIDEIDALFTAICCCSNFIDAGIYYIVANKTCFIKSMKIHCCKTLQVSSESQQEEAYQTTFTNTSEHAVSRGNEMIAKLVAYKGHVIDHRNHFMTDM